MKKRGWEPQFGFQKGWISAEDPRGNTHHFEPLDQSAEIGVFLVVLDEGGLHPLPSALDVHPGPVHLRQVHSLQVPEPPEQDLGEEEEAKQGHERAALSLEAKGVGSEHPLGVFGTGK